jgi:hypothetical protein
LMGHALRKALGVIAGLRTRCTTSSNGRSVAIQPRRSAASRTARLPGHPAGRARLRECVKVEYALAHVGHWQGRRARYRGIRKNLFDLRRSPWATTSTSSPASPPPAATSWQPDNYLTGALVLGRDSSSLRAWLVWVRV